MRPSIPENGTPIPMNQRMALTVDEAARMLGITEPHLRTFIRTGELETFQLGRSRRIAPEALRAFIESKHRRAVQP